MAEAGSDQRAGTRPGWPATGNGAGNVAGGPVSGVLIQAGAVSGGVHLAAGARFAVPLPRQLPAGPARLVDRAGELSLLDGLLAGTARGPLLVVITGAPGMGKTAVALWWLHARDGEFPDGQLHADLGGEAVADVLARWLRALGVPPEWIPATEAELAALWRSATAGRRLAVLVENAASVAGVRMLLPGAGPSVVAVTSRRRLPAAAGDGAQFIHMGPLPAEEAVGLLGQIAGADRVAAEQAAALRLVTYCGGVPLAVCAAAGQLAISAGERIADAAAGLDPLNALDDGADKETGMRAGLDAAYAALDPGTARAYRLLGLHPGPDFTAGLAAAALDAGRAEARAVLARLATACLAEPAGQGRYRFHDLIRAHARDLAGQQEPAEGRRAVLARIAGWYLCNCAEAERLLQRYRHGLRRDAAPPPREGPEVTAETALDWMEAERHGLRAVVEAAAERPPGRQLAAGRRDVAAVPVPRPLPRAARHQPGRAGRRPPLRGRRGTGADAGPDRDGRPAPGPPGRGRRLLPAGARPVATTWATRTRQREPCASSAGSRPSAATSARRSGCSGRPSTVTRTRARAARGRPRSP